VVDDLTWEFRLREGIRFHDGTPFTPEDIAFSIARIPTVPNSPGPFTVQVRPVTRVEVVDARTVRLHTSAPTPFLDRDFAQVFMLSRRIHADATLADFNSGRALVGTGAYRMSRSRSGSGTRSRATRTSGGRARPGTAS
jgi:peptide/nickel transport system substrate-binding protein